MIDLDPQQAPADPASVNRPVRGMPSGLSPSKVEAFVSCPQAFRFSAVDRLPEPASTHTAKGTLVHRALELLFVEEAPERTLERAMDCLHQAISELQASADWADLQLGEEEAAAFVAHAERLVHGYFAIEDPRTVHPIGIELRLEVEFDGLALRGIIDRLELDADGELVVTDYKTGRTPSVQYERGRLGGVHFYAYLCERLFGRRPARVQLMYLGDPTVITAVPTEQSIRFLPKRTAAVWSAIERAVTMDDFRPRVGALCGSCFWRDWCPAHGGEPGRAVDEVPLVLARRRGEAVAL